MTERDILRDEIAEHDEQERDRHALVANDQPTTCPHDGARTEQVGTTKRDVFGRYLIEECLDCGRQFRVYEE